MERKPAARRTGHAPSHRCCCRLCRRCQLEQPRATPRHAAHAAPRRAAPRRCRRTAPVPRYAVHRTTHGTPAHALRRGAAAESRFVSEHGGASRHVGQPHAQQGDAPHQAEPGSYESHGGGGVRLARGGRLDNRRPAAREERAYYAVLRRSGCRTGRAAAAGSRPTTRKSSGPNRTASGPLCSPPSSTGPGRPPRTMTPRRPSPRRRCPPSPRSPAQPSPRTPRRRSEPRRPATLASPPCPPAHRLPQPRRSPHPHRCFRPGSSRRADGAGRCQVCGGAADAHAHRLRHVSTEPGAARSATRPMPSPSAASRHTAPPSPSRIARLRLAWCTRGTAGLGVFCGTARV